MPGNVNIEYFAPSYCPIRPIEDVTELIRRPVTTIHSTYTVIQQLICKHHM